MDVLLSDAAQLLAAIAHAVRFDHTQARRAGRSALSLVLT